MRFKQIKTQHHKNQYRLYSPTVLTNAYKAVVEGGKSVTGTAKQYNVPITTLRDRVLGNVDPETFRSGRNPVLSSFQESTLVEHLKVMADFGYGYSRQEVVDLASDYAVQLGVRKKSHAFTMKWFRGFVSRWPELRVTKARSLEIARAKCASESIVNNYFQELSDVIKKNGFDKNPHLIYNVDEKGFSLCHTPPSVVCNSQNPPQAVTSGKSATTTVIGCGSASGASVPPFFIYAGKKMMEELMEGATPGAVGRVSDSGWSNSVLFRDYLENHFLKYVPLKEGQKALLLMDGHKTHATVGLVEWAKERNIILYILPAHTSHILQPLDVGCYGPLQRMYNSECHKFMRNSQCTITRYNICNLVCKVYYKALSAENLMSTFKKTGIFPCNRNAIPATSLKPTEVFAHSLDDTDDIPQETSDEKIRDGHETEFELGTEHCIANDIEKDNEAPKQNSPEVEISESTFFNAKVKKLKRVKSEKGKKDRNTMSKIISGHCITEDSILEKMNEHIKDYTKTSKQSANRSKGCKRINKTKKTAVDSQVPSGSGYKPKEKENKNMNESAIFDSEDSEIDIADEELCCVCNAFSPKEVRESYQLIITKWAQCDGIRDEKACNHWTHLRFCSSVNVLRRNDKFLCPHCITE